MGRAEARRAQQSARRATGKKAGKTGIRRFFTWKKLLAYVVSLGALFVGACIALYLYVDVPAGNAAASMQANVYKLANGKVLTRTGKVNRESIPISQVPKDVQRTFVAVENKNFYTDAGVDIQGTARGILNTLMGKGKQGGSTITQQYVKNYYLDQNQTVTRKVKELVIALKLDREKSKDQILEGYLNTSFFGRNAYGIEAAARAYYNKDASKLNVAEGAYLAALVQAPSQYDWAVAGPIGKQLVMGRWNKSLDNMVAKGWLDEAKRKSITFPVPQKPKPAPGLEGQTGYLVQEANRELVNAGVSEQQLAAGGWTITLNIDPEKQAALEQAVKDKLSADLNPSARKVDAQAQLGAVSVDPKTGKVLAMYGGPDYFKHYTNNATREDYQPASTFKPVILASALENSATTQDGQPINANTIYDGTSGRPVRGSDTAFSPPNEDKVDYGQITVQKAMNNSVNSVFAQMAVDVHLDKLKQTAIDLGMNGKAGGFDERPAMSLGVMGASPLDMAGVYATLDNHGKKVTPALVKSASNGSGVTAGLPDPIGSQVISRSTADSVTSVLTGVVADGTGSAVQNANQAVAGKTGTSDDDKSAWFTGYTPDLVTSVGMFGEGDGGKQVPLTGAGGGGRVNGGGYPAQVWSAYTTSVLSGESASQFDLNTSMGAGVTPTQAPSSTHSASQAPASPTATATGSSQSPASPTATATGPSHTPPSSQGPNPPTSHPTGGPTSTATGDTGPGAPGGPNNNQGLMPNGWGG